MRYIRLGNSDLEVSRLGLDCHSLGVAQRDRGWDPFSYDGEVFAIRTVHAALDSGITVFDTAVAGSTARAESLLGKALHGRTSDIVLASRLPDAIKRTQIRDTLLASMRRLRAERLGIVYLSDRIAAGERAGGIYFEDCLDELHRLRRAGLIGHVGLTVSDPATSLPLIDSGAFGIVQMRFNVNENREASAALDRCQSRGIGVGIVKPLAAGTFKTIVSALDSNWPGSMRARECCLKHLLGDRRVHLINVGMRWEHEVLTNSRLVAGFDPLFARPNQAVLPLAH